MRYFIRLPFFLLLCFVSVASAQDSLRLRYGLLGGWSVNVHTADFRGLPNIPNCCSQFSSGNGGDILAGLFGELPVANDLLLGVTASYIDQSALMKKVDGIRIIVAGNGQDGSDEHSIDTKLSTIGLEPNLSYRPFGNFFVSAGLRLGLVLAKTYSQKEQIIDPPGTGTFLDSLGNDSHQRIRNVYSGTLPSAASLITQVFAGVRYELPLNTDKTFFLAPQVSYAFSLSNVVDGLDWKPNGIRAGVGLVYSPKADTRIYKYDTIYYRDTVTQTIRNLAQKQISLASTDKLKDVTINGNTVLERTIMSYHYAVMLPDLHDVTASINAVGVDDEGNETPIATLKVEEFLSTRAHPLLGYIFFGEGDSTIPSRYDNLDVGTAKKFRLEQLFGNQPLEIYHTVLNILGYRMKQYPKAKLMLTGCNSNQGVELANQKLSQARVDAVKNYFVNAWGISPDRLITSARDLPEKPSNPRTPDGQEENRRVEINSDVPEVIDVFIANDTTRTPLPPQVRLKLATKSSNGIDDWNIDILQGRKALKHFHGTKDAPSYIDWDLANDPSSVPKYNEPLRLFIQTKSMKGDVATDSVTLPTEIITLAQKKARKKGDVVIDKYNLVLFNFGTSDITPAHLRTVSMIKQKLQPASEILVEGYTDRTGSNASNMKLSTSRAQSTANALGRNDIKVRGIGEERLLFSNDTPEGRFFCRTVQITVRTPVQ